LSRKFIPGKRRLLKPIVVNYMLCGADQDKTYMLSAVIAWRKMLAIYAGYLMILGMNRIVFYAIDSRSWHGLPRLELVSNVSH